MSSVEEEIKKRQALAELRTNGVPKPPKVPKKAPSKGGRPKGSHPNPDAEKPGRKEGWQLINPMGSPQDIAAQIRALEGVEPPKESKELTQEGVQLLKGAVFQLFDEGTVKTLRQAAEVLGISPSMVHQWKRKDPDFAERVALGREVVADRLVEELIASHNDVAKFFLLKEIRPEYNDRNRKVEVKNEKILHLITEYRQKAGVSTPIDMTAPKELPARSLVIDSPDARIVESESSSS